MLPILARTTRPEEFPWRVIPTPNGCIAGASVAIAIMESSNNQEVATQLAYDLVFDRDMQLALSDSASLIPALMNTYTDGRFMRTESFCAGQKVGHLWTSAAQTMQGQAMSVHSAQRNADVRQIVIAALNGTLAYADALGQLATV
jgi:hypothetical protein